MRFPRFRIWSLMLLIALTGIVFWAGLTGYRYWDYRRQMAVKAQVRTIVLSVRVAGGQRT